MAGNVVVKVEDYGYIRGQDGASAYEQAVAGGYPGTEEQFAQDLINFTPLAAQAAASAAAAQTAQGLAETAQAAAEAAQSAAQGYAGSASDSALLAAQFENNASGYAGRANACAGDAEYSASVASSERAEAEAAQAEATRQAGIAETLAGAAATSAGTASTSATDAAASAVNAAASATAAGNAQSAAETAQGLAETAQAAAETAAESVSGSADQISQNTSDISDLKSAVGTSFISRTPVFTLEQGAISSTNGSPTASTSANFYKRIRTADFVAVDDTPIISITIPNGYWATIAKYSSNDVSDYIETVPAIRGTNLFTCEYPYIKFTIGRDDNSVFTPEDFPTDELSINFSFIADKPLRSSISEIAAYDLYPTGDATERATDILRIANSKGICRLAPGDYYISHFSAAGSIVGAAVGKTRLIFKDSTNPWYAIRLRDKAYVGNLTIEAFVEGGGNITPAKDYSQGVSCFRIGTDAATTALTNESEITIENVTIKKFSGCGIFCRHSSQGSNGNSFINVRAEYCSAGFYLGEKAEYITMAGCYANWCYTGLVVMGGNNIINGCVFSENEVNCALPETDSYGSTANDAHGIIDGCKFSHAGFYSHTYPADGSDGGYDIFAGAQASAELISNCYIGYPIYLKDRGQPLMISGCEIRDNCVVTADNSKLALMGCMIENRSFSPTILNGGAVKIIGCLYYSLGSADN